MYDGYDIVIRADGHSTTALMEAVLTLFPLDTFVKAPAAVMQQVDKPSVDAPIVAEFQKLLNKANGSPVTIERIDRFVHRYTYASSVDHGCI